MNNSVLVFKTSVETIENINSLRPILDTMAGTGKWNFALDDCDRILRIVSTNIQPGPVIREMANRGFECSELEY